MNFFEFNKTAIKTILDEESISCAIAYCDQWTHDHDHDGFLRDEKLGPKKKSFILINWQFSSEKYRLKRPDAVFVFGPKERFVGDKSFEEIVVPMLTKDTKVIYLD